MALPRPARAGPLIGLRGGLREPVRGMGTAAFVALLMALCRPPVHATQYALLSALARLRPLVRGPGGRLRHGPVVSRASWTVFFFLTFLVALPGLVLLLVEARHHQGPLTMTVRRSICLSRPRPRGGAQVLRRTPRCPKGSSPDWIDFDFHGHQIVAHLSPAGGRPSQYQRVDGDNVPVRHFGSCSHGAVARDGRQAQGRRHRFVIEPHVRFKGLPASRRRCSSSIPRATRSSSRRSRSRRGSSRSSKGDSSGEPSPDHPRRRKRKTPRLPRGWAGLDDLPLVQHALVRISAPTFTHKASKFLHRAQVVLGVSYHS